MRERSEHAKNIELFDFICQFYLATCLKLQLCKCSFWGLRTKQQDFCLLRTGPLRTAYSIHPSSRILLIKGWGGGVTLTCPTI